MLRNLLGDSIGNLPCSSHACEIFVDDLKLMLPFILTSDDHGRTTNPLIANFQVSKGKASQFTVSGVYRDPVYAVSEKKFEGDVCKYLP